MQRLLPMALWFGLVAESANAHGLGQRYDLPIPLSLYLLGAGLAVAASFAFVTLFRRSARPSVRRVRLCGRVRPALTRIVEVIAFAAFALVLSAGLFGQASTFKNIAPVALWVIWWVGFTFVCAFAGNLWPLVSPVAILVRWAGMLWRNLAKAGVPRRLPYPERLGAWPAVFLFLLFAWLELVAPHRDSPRNIAYGILLYCALGGVSSFVFGFRTWQRSIDPFAVAFRLFGKFAPLCLAHHHNRWRWCLQPYGFGLLSTRQVPPSITAFTLVLLSTVTVDGLLETPAWSAISEPVITRFPNSSLATLVPPTILLIIAPLIFAATYGTVIFTMSLLTHAPNNSRFFLTPRFIYSLIPIAIAYHLAHYLSFLLTAGQLTIPLASDPYGVGWDLFGTTLYRLNIGIVDARFVWISAVTAIVIGHIVATWVAHETAVEIFQSPVQIRRSQLPMVVLMIAYTMTSLWILAQPIVN